VSASLVALVALVSVLHFVGASVSVLHRGSADFYI
jgi:hypothetical protein